MQNPERGLDLNNSKSHTINVHAKGTVPSSTTIKQGGVPLPPTDLSPLKPNYAHRYVVYLCSLRRENEADTLVQLQVASRFVTLTIVI